MLNFLKRYWFVFLFSFLFLIPRSYCYAPNSYYLYNNYVGGSWENVNVTGDRVYFGAGSSNYFELGKNNGTGSNCTNEYNYYTNAPESCFESGFDSTADFINDLSMFPHGLLLYNTHSGTINYNIVEYSLFIDFMSQSLQNDEDVIMIFNFAFYNSFNTNKVDYSHYINLNKLRFDLSDNQNHDNNIVVTESSSDFIVYDYDVSNVDGFCLNTNNDCSQSQLIYNITYVTVKVNFKWSSSYTNKLVTRLFNIDFSTNIYSDLGINSSLLSEVFVPKLYRVSDYEMSYDNYTIDYFSDYTQFMYITYPDDVIYSRIMFNSCMMNNFSYAYFSPDLSNFNGVFFKGFYNQTDFTLNYKLNLPYKVEYDPLRGSPTYFIEFDRSKDMDFVFLYSENTLAGTNQELWANEIQVDSNLSNPGSSSGGGRHDNVTELGFFGKILNWFSNGWNWVKENVIGIGADTITKDNSSNNSTSISKAIPQSCTITLDSRAIVRPVLANYSCDSNNENCTFMNFTIYDYSGTNPTHLNETIDLTSDISNPESYINEFLPSLTIYKNIFNNILTDDGSDEMEIFVKFATLFLFILLILAIARRWKI